MATIRKLALIVFVNEESAIYHSSRTANLYNH